ncbi:MAG: glycosyltransferase family 4 protein [Candidatus Aenigmatarchaeota archaeon]
MSKTIWIINEYAGSVYHGMTFRHYYLAKELVKEGFNVYIITASYSHLLKKFPKVEQTFTIEKIDNINYVWVKVPYYKHAHDKKRVIKWFIFNLRLLFLPNLKIDKPDIVLVSSPEPFQILPGYYLSKKFNAKLIFEVRDLWPLTLIELGNYSKNHPVIKIMQWVENFAYKKANAVITVLPNAMEYMIEHGLEYSKFYYVPNGISLDEVINQEPISQEIRSLIPTNKFVVGYTGTIGHANALQYLIQTANILKDYNIHFVIVGDGKEKEKLIQMVKDLNLKNVTFIEPIPKRQVQSMLKLFDVCYVGLLDSPLFKYGVSPNKIFDYMASEKPIIFAVNSINNPVNEAGCGITVDEPNNPDAIARAILYMYELSEEERRKLGNKGKLYLLHNHTYESLAKRLINVFEKISIQKS